MKYLACIWCGNHIPHLRKYAKYCSVRCKREALGQRSAIINSKYENKRYEQSTIKKEN